MKSNYERQRYTLQFALIALGGLAVEAFCLWLLMGEFGWKEGVILGITALILVVIYVISFLRLHKIYQEVETISKAMNDVIEHGSNGYEEVYAEGTMGVLYSNFYKMVHAMEDSRNRELDEKVFLRDIISDISHQLKTPLASLNVFVDLLLEDKIQDPEKKKQVLREAESQLSRMEWMVLSMLKLARIEAGAIQFERKEERLQAILHEAAEGVRVLMEQKNQELNIICTEDVTMDCDGGWLTEAIINLLKNASDYSPEGTEICLEVEEDAVCHRIYVKDHGPGIPEEEIPNIFKRFYRVHQEVNPNSVGIGLSLTKSIVEGMGGRIHVNSQVGEYTWFVLTFVK